MGAETRIILGIDSHFFGIFFGISRHPLSFFLSIACRVTAVTCGGRITGYQSLAMPHISQNIVGGGGIALPKRLWPFGVTSLWKSGGYATRPPGFLGNSPFIPTICITLTIPATPIICDDGHTKFIIDHYDGLYGNGSL